LDKILAKYGIKTAGGAGAQIIVPILEVIGIHVELVVVGVPVGVDETSARPALALRYPCLLGNQTLFIRAHFPNAKLLFLYPAEYKNLTG